MLSIQNLYTHLKSSDPKLFEALDALANASSPKKDNEYSQRIVINDLDPRNNATSPIILSGDSNFVIFKSFLVSLREPIVSDLKIRLNLISGTSLDQIANLIIPSSLPVNRLLTIKNAAKFSTNSVLTLDIV